MLIKNYLILGVAVGLSSLFLGCTKSSDDSLPISTLNQKSVITAAELPNSYAAKSPDRDAALSEYPALAVQLDKMERQILAPSTEDLQAQQGLLAKGNSGVVRLLERTAPTIVSRSKGCYYSFADLTHAYGYGSDLELEGGRFGVGFAGADYGFMTDLGAKSLDQITDADRSYALNYVTPSKEADARPEYQKFGSGLVVNGQKYANWLDAIDGHSYLLRSINYGESDVLVAFQVMRTDSDGSRVIAWQMVKTYAVPLLDKQTPYNSKYPSENLNTDAIPIADRAGQLAQHATLLSKVDADEKIITSPAADDLNANKDFLSTSNSGIFRLMPAKGGVQLSHLGGYASMFCFKDGSRNCADLYMETNTKFASQTGGADFGIITGLRNLPIGQVDSNSDGMAYLTAYTPTSDEPTARKEQEVFVWDNFRTVNGHDYTGHIDAKNGYTYAIRSITYDYSDVLVTFQVVRKDSDGSLIVVYKLLQNNPVPKLK